MSRDKDNRPCEVRHTTSCQSRQLVHVLRQACWLGGEMGKAALPAWQPRKAGWGRHKSFRAETGVLAREATISFAPADLPEGQDSGNSNAFEGADAVAGRQERPVAGREGQVRISWLAALPAPRIR